MSFTSANIETAGSSGLPEPIWERRGKATQVTEAGVSVECDMCYGKPPMVDQELIDEGVIYIQYGRLSQRDYTNRPVPRVRPTRIKWYSSYSGGAGINGTGELGGAHSGVTQPRPNVIPVVAQNRAVAQAVPYWAFYKVAPSEVISGDPNSSGGFTLNDAPYHTGNDKRKNFTNVNNYLPGASSYRRRPQRAMTRTRNGSTTYWFCRLIIVRDGRAVSYGPISTALVVRPNELNFNEHFMASVVPDLRGNPQTTFYAFTRLTAEIITKKNA